MRSRLRSRLGGANAAAQREGYRALLRNHDYRLLYIAIAVSMSGTWAYGIALVVFVFDTTHSPGWVAAALTARFLSAIVASPLGGLIADRVERVRVMVTADVLAMAAQGAMAIVAVLHGPVIIAIAFAAMSAATSASWDPAARAATPAVVGEKHLALANSAQTAIESLAIIVGPAFAGLLLVVGAPAVVFAANAATFGLSAILVSRMHSRSQPADITKGGRIGPLKQMASGIKAFTESSTVALLAGFCLLASFVYGTDTVLLAVVSQDRLGTGSAGYGYLQAALGLGGLLIAGLMNRVTASQRLGRMIVLGMLVYCLPTALLTIVRSPLIAATIEVARGTGTIVVDVLAITALQRLVKPDLVARVFGVFFALVLGAISLGALLMPILLGNIGLNGTLLIMAFAIPTLTLVAHPWLGRLDAQALGQLAEIEGPVSLLEALDILAGATRTALEGLARSASEETVAPGTIVIREGAEADDFFVLVDGRVGILATGPAGAERVVDVLNGPNYFGEIGLLDHRPRTATVHAMTRVTLLRISGDEFMDALAVGTVSPAAFVNARRRLARTHPLDAMSFGQANRS